MRQRKKTLVVLGLVTQYVKAMNFIFKTMSRTQLSRALRARTFACGVGRGRPPPRARARGAGGPPRPGTRTVYSSIYNSNLFSTHAMSCTRRSIEDTVTRYVTNISCATHAVGQPS